MISVLPPQYLDWAKDTKIEGKSNLFFSLKGKFSEPRNLKPEFTAHLMVNDGTISNAKAPVPMNKFNLGLNIDLPNLNAEELRLALKKLSFDLGKKNTFNAAIKTQGISCLNLKNLL